MNACTYHDDHTAGDPGADYRLAVSFGADAYAEAPPLESDCIDGTQTGVRRFLAGMAQMMGDVGEVLTLQLGAIVTVAMAAPDGGLTVAAYLPPDGPRLARGAAPAGCELAWHAERGCDVLVRYLPLHALRSEPDALGAIMDTADLAQALVTASR